MFVFLLYSSNWKLVLQCSLDINGCTSYMAFWAINIVAFLYKQFIWDNILAVDWRWCFYSKSFSILCFNIEKIVSHEELVSCNWALLLLWCRIHPRNWRKLRFKWTFTFLSLQQTSEKENTSPWFPGQNCALMTCEQVRLCLWMVNCIKGKRRTQAQEVRLLE